MFGRKKKLTTEQLAEILYYFSKKFSVDYVPYEMSKENSWFQWGNTTDNLCLTVGRVEELTAEWYMENC